MWSVKFTKKAADSLLDLDSDVQKRIRDKISWLKDNFSSVNPESLSGELSHLNKLRVGDWRVLYKVDHDAQILWIVRVGHRSDIYER
jgi:mRNA interferase RelE/StbE